MRYFLAIFIFLLIATMSIMGFRGSRSTKPPLEVFPDMDRQAKYKPQAASDFFEDGRADRPVVPGTVMFGSYNSDDYFTTGKVNGEFGSGFPVAINHDLMRLGQEKFNIFCAVCHGESGNGNGVTKASILTTRMAATPSYHDDRIRNMPEGQIFDTITHGKNYTMTSGMGPYGAKLSPKERWAVIAYLRALQRAHNATVSDVPPEKRGELGL